MTRKVTGIDFSPQDIDILDVEGDYGRARLQVGNLHENKFVNGQFEIGFSFEVDLWQFANVNYEELKEMNDNGVSYRLLSVEDYLNVYKKASKDGSECFYMKKITS